MKPLGACHGKSMVLPKTANISLVGIDDSLIDTGGIKS
jgi:hypothetical protein